MFSLSLDAAKYTSIRSLLFNIKSDELPDTTIALAVYVNPTEDYINGLVTYDDLSAENQTKVSNASLYYISHILAITHCKGTFVNAGNFKEFYKKDFSSDDWDTLSKSLKDRSDSIIRDIKESIGTVTDNSALVALVGPNVDFRTGKSQSGILK